MSGLRTVQECINSVPLVEKLLPIVTLHVFPSAMKKTNKDGTTGKQICNLDENKPFLGNEYNLIL